MYLKKIAEMKITTLNAMPICENKKKNMFTFS